MIETQKHKTHMLCHLQLEMHLEREYGTVRMTDSVYLYTNDNTITI